MTNMDVYEQASNLQKQLHSIPEASNCETKTKETLMAFLSGYPDLELVDKGKWFYAVHREGPLAPSIAFRAEMDAMVDVDGQTYHGCGHDGHMAIVAALAAWTSGKTLRKNVYFLFQHAEETGEGAQECKELFENENVDTLYGFHNCPGYPEGSVLLLPNTVACASRGLVLHFEGEQAHAAYPESGHNPVFPIANFFSRWDELINPASYNGMVLATPIYITAGSHAFGVAAGSGEIGLTLRSWYNDDLQKIENDLIAWASELAEKAGMTLTHKIQDVFHATVNNPKIFRRCEMAVQKAGITRVCPSEPFRWSDDFGRYCSWTRTCYLGIGSGEDAQPLHTPQYQWNHAVTKTAMKLFQTIILD